MAKLKTSKKYYLSVEGETEQWYFQWLQQQINLCPEAKFKIIFDCKIQNNPIKRVKSLSITGKTELYHISDYESNEEAHAIEFQALLDNLKNASKLGRQVKYNLGYSNFTFELWILLHKGNYNNTLNHRRQYLPLINQAYNQCFETLDHYKTESNFKKLLTSLSLENVISAIERSKAIMTDNETKGYRLQEYKGYKYYQENPSLTVWHIINKVFKECNLI